MNKHKGLYYLQYAGPGTNLVTYSDGVYTATSPLGPYSYAPYSPFSRKSSGFVPGAGHSTTFTDKHGNLWHAATAVISVKHMFERWLGLFPAGFDDKGILYCQTVFGDYPHYIPEYKTDFLTESTFTNWMLLSYKKDVKSSSEIKDYPVVNAFDENIKTYWCAENTKNEWLSLNLKSNCEVKAIQLNFAEHETEIRGHVNENHYQYLIEYSDNGLEWLTLIDKSNNKLDHPHDYIPLKEPINTQYLRLQVLGVPDGKIAVSGFRVFGKGHMASPKEVKVLNVNRNKKDERCVNLIWDKINNSQGYIIRYGIEADRLYSSIMVYDDNQLEIKCLNKGVDYYFTIDSFNENGVTTGKIRILSKANNLK